MAICCGNGRKSLEKQRDFCRKVFELLVCEATKAAWHFALSVSQGRSDLKSPPKKEEKEEDQQSYGQ